jgi:hypothetical protein
MKRFIAIGLLVAGVTVQSGTALAANPHGSSNPTGPPSQSCEMQPSAPGGGQSSNSPGSPFTGGTADSHYNEQSQYDVACFQVSQPHP